MGHRHRHRVPPRCAVPEYIPHDLEAPPAPVAHLKVHAVQPWLQVIEAGAQVSPLQESTGAPERRVPKQRCTNSQHVSVRPG